MPFPLNTLKHQTKRLLIYTMWICDQDTSYSDMNALHNFTYSVAIYAHANKFGICIKFVILEKL